VATRKLSEFEQAFADARKAGQKEFDFKGKKFHTRRADEETTSVGGKPKMGEYKPRRSEPDMSAYVPRRKEPDMSAYVPRGTEPDMSGYVPRREPEPLELSKGGKVGSASKRADGCAMRGKTRGKMV
jgi:hypothetical protein